MWWIKLLQLIACLSILVIVHEMGHFLFAKLFKCRVEKFYLFFNPWFSIFKFRIGETEYGLGWIPFGGYVKISGMIDESMDTEALKEPPKPYEFRSKPAWQRLLIMVGGVLMNLLLAAIIYISMSFSYGETYISAKDAKYGFEFSPLAEEIGFRDGDMLLTVDGAPVDNYITAYKSLLLDSPSYMEVDRGGETVRVYISEEYIPRMLKDKEFLAPRIPFVVSEVQAGGPADKAGIKAGDAIVGIDSLQGVFMSDVFNILEANKSRTLTFTVNRDSAGFVQTVSILVEVTSNGKIEVWLTPAAELIDFSTRKYTFAEAIPAGFRRAGNEIRDYWKQLKMLVKPETEAYKSVGGVIAIGNIFPDTWSWARFWDLTAIISIMLAVINILPIPALDGGHVMFLLYEVIPRRKPSDKFLERAQLVGLFILFAILIYANGNDIVKLVQKWLAN